MKNLYGSFANTERRRRPQVCLRDDPLERPAAYVRDRLVVCVHFDIRSTGGLFVRSLMNSVFVEARSHLGPIATRGQLLQRAGRAVLHRVGRGSIVRFGKDK